MTVTRDESLRKFPQLSLTTFYAISTLQQRKRTAHLIQAVSFFSRSIQRYFLDDNNAKILTSSKTNNSETQEKSLNPSAENLENGLKGTNQMSKWP